MRASSAQGRNSIQDTAQLLASPCQVGQRSNYCCGNAKADYSNNSADYRNIVASYSEANSMLQQRHNEADNKLKQRHSEAHSKLQQRLVRHIASYSSA